MADTDGKGNKWRRYPWSLCVVMSVWHVITEQSRRWEDSRQEMKHMVVDLSQYHYLCGG